MVHIREKMKEGKVLQFSLTNKVAYIIFSNSQYFSKNRGVLRFFFNRIASTHNNIRNNSFVMHLAQPRQSLYLHTCFHMPWKNIQRSIEKIEGSLCSSKTIANTKKRYSLLYWSRKTVKISLFSDSSVHLHQSDWSIGNQRGITACFTRATAIVQLCNTILLIRISVVQLCNFMQIGYPLTSSSTDNLPKVEVFVEEQRYVRLSRNFRSFSKETIDAQRFFLYIFISTKWVARNSIK